MKTTVFENARIVDPSRDMDEIGTVIVEGRKIQLMAWLHAHNR